MRATLKPLNLIFPPQCSVCRVIIEQNGSLCADCWQKLHFISHPHCQCCGYPFAYDMGEDAQCPACIAVMPEFHGHRSILYFDDASKPLVHQLKYYDNALMVDRFAQWLHQLAPDWIEQEGVILLPIPIHPFRLLKRKYNQSALLVGALAKRSGKEAAYTLLKRVKNRPPQASLPRQQRLKNLSGAFEVNPRHKDNVKGRPVILIDDVMTTGATLNACAKKLKKAGSGRVYALTIARTVLED